MIAYLIARVARESSRMVLVLVSSDSEAQQIEADLHLFGVSSLVFPWWGTAAYAVPAQHNEVFGRRMRALTALIRNEPKEEPNVIIASARAFAQYLAPPSISTDREFILRIGTTIQPADVAQELADLGYQRVAQVTVGGEFALRGEVLDVWPSSAEQPVRAVLEYDEVSSLRYFEPGTQMTVERAEVLRVYPMRETLWSEEHLERLRRTTQDWVELRHARERGVDLYEQSNPAPFWFPVLFETPATLLDYGCPLTVWVDRPRILSNLETVRREHEAVFASEHFKRPLPRPERVLVAPDALMDRATDRAIIIDSPLDAHVPGDQLRLACDPPRSFFGNVSYLKEELANMRAASMDVVVVADTEAQQKRIEHLLAQYSVTVLHARLSAGFGLPEHKTVVIQENEIFGRRKRAPASLKRVESAPIETFLELDEGDHVVHVNYGIGVFRGIRRMVAGGNERDYIHLEYAGTEFVYIPIEQVNLIQRYIGSGGGAPRLDTIGGKSWEKRKDTVRKRVEDLADRLIKLYSRRQRAQGFAFPADTEWQLEFESGFPYEETDDQLRCIAEIKADMERPSPMDRLVCGDVGYGKTELAMRAAFKGVISGKQVALLAPTTILVEQHYENMLERFERFPVKIGMLSRFVNKADQRAVLAGLKAGTIDLVVGTHRLLQKDVVFKDLGLIVIDEEQRFGVKDKERLKELKATIDCLTLTATPIPRTLHMSLLKIRDMSLLTTPPMNRHPIQTHIAEFNEETVGKAIRTEVERGGQVFFLHNRVETLDNVRRFVENLVPEVLVESAHGQMGPTDLEDIMHRFIHGAFQVLVATTIIENGIDIPNVNTIIIDRADMYGVSQLYQLRGRVGRSDRQAYAYLLYPEQRALSELAMKRLQIISDFTELGSGFKIALKDLEVRGAGNLLGAQQSGDIGSIGFDLYLKLLDEAIRERTADAEPEESEVYLELEYSGFIPDSYISEPMEKMEVYKKIAGVSTEEQLESVIAEILDRFGPLPDEIQSLLSLAEIRILGRRLHIASMRERRGVLRVEFGKVADISVDRVLALLKHSGGSVRLDPAAPNVLLMDTNTIGLKEKSEFIRGRLSQLL